MSAASLPSLSMTAIAGAPADVQVIPTSFAQERFFLLEQIEPDAAIYTIPVALRLCGPLDAAALEGAINAVVTRQIGVSLSLAGIWGDVTVASLAAAVTAEQAKQGDSTEPALAPVDRSEYTQAARNPAILKASA